METYIGGYIIDIKKVNDIDQIIKVMSLNRFFNIYTRGTLKSKSKNGKLISLGNFIECSIFLSPNINKLSKLKKIEVCTIIKYRSYWGDYYHKLLLKIMSHFKSNSDFFMKQLNDYEKIANANSVLVWWLWSLAQTIKITGHGPIIDKCIDCLGKSPIYSFEIQAGGLKCKNHSFKKNLKQSVKEIAQYIYLFSLPFNEYLKKCDRYFLPRQEKVIIQFVNYHMGIYL